MGCCSRVVAAEPHGHRPTRILSAALDCRGSRGSLALDGAVERLAFAAFVGAVLIPPLHPGDLANGHRHDRFQRKGVNRHRQLVAAEHGFGNPAMREWGWTS